MKIRNFDRVRNLEKMPPHGLSLATRWDPHGVKLCP